MTTRFMNTTAAAALAAAIAAPAAAQNMIDTSDVMVDGADATFSSVSIEQDGYLVLHTMQDGEVVVPQSIGSTPISAGDNSDVTVTAEYPLVEGENYVAMLHVESNGNSTYDFGPGNTDVDTPVVVDGAPVTSSFAGSGTMMDEASADGMNDNAMDGDMAMADLEAHIAGWPEASQKAAMEMWDKYGAPDEMAETLLIWHDTGPFVRSYVYGEAIDHDWPAPHQDVLEQFIHYDVPADKFDELAMFDGSIIAERTRAEMSARCHSEFANLIALNLGNDVVTGEKTVEEARAAYEEAVREHMAGNSPEIAQRLTFEPAQQDITNSDEAVIDM
ncbi:hypothetical protein OG2516_17595 [Oceanicola granulosus HTCC2516]|uniref:DUF7282 domain-containing protein n=1 Tax=Oceanicola granulosus (strain ATCC BAA-861 / DSM 15982 / KCTC 12143 / HTCC2516) TaxID=314256 RepID=Q2CF61_OCEGH|nr:hypothetical protein [Oceanicola granulosus]EAR51266.1 hypothetical protein OG2516_17595 [Oceanicola granulosus HTCC2516]